MPRKNLVRLPLTFKQLQTLSFISESLNENGYPPNLPEIAANFGIRKTAAWERVQTLARKGYIIINKEKHRGIRVLF
jgi:SOS-response transcriptional repressor LexA